MTSILFKLFWNTKSPPPSPPKEEKKEIVDTFVLHVDGTKEPITDVKDGEFIPFGSDGKCVQYDEFKFQPPDDYNTVASEETGIDIYGPAIITKKKKITTTKRRRSSRIAAQPKKKKPYGSY